MSQSSILFNILDRATRLVQSQISAQTKAVSSLPYAPDTERGARPAPSSRLPFELDPEASALKLDDINDVITQLRAWLQANPLFLTILDESIRQEVRAMERRTNRMGIVINAIFTVLGAFIGLVILPLATLVTTWLNHK